MVIDNPQPAAFILNTDPETINGWSHDWLVDFNPNKTSTLLISRRQHPVFHTSLEMNYVVLNETTSHKHLGLTLSNTCCRTEHINNIAETAWSRLSIMRLLKFKIGQKALEKCTLHLFVSYMSIMTRNGITVLLM